MKKTKRLTLLAVLTAAALCVFVLEAQLPPLTPVPGIKLGLANIFTLFALYVLDAKSALALLLVRVVLGSLVTGQVSAMGYSLCGGLLSYLVLLLFYRRIPGKQLWALSILSALAHNLGQLLLASVVMDTFAIFWYTPMLLLAAMVTGAFTGLTAQMVLKHWKKIK
ncbi:MAG: Gx transporter family protein [Candidatus Avoscillospira sp.]